MREVLGLAVLLNSMSYNFFIHEEIVISRILCSELAQNNHTIYKNRRKFDTAQQFSIGDSISPIS